MDPRSDALVFHATCSTQAQERQRATLQSIFTLNANVEHLRKHGVTVEATEGVEEVLRRLPITCYADYQPAIQAAVQAAEAGDDKAFAAAAADVCGALPTFFGCTTGTTGASKHIPVHAQRVDEANNLFAMVGKAVAVAFPGGPPDGKDIQLGCRLPCRKLPNGVRVGAVTACGMDKVFEDLERGEPAVQRIFSGWSSPPAVWLAGDLRTAAYLHLLFALRQRERIRSLCDGFASGVALALNVLVDFQQALLADLEAGALGAAWDPARTASPLAAPPEEVAAQLSAQLAPAPELAEALQKEFAAGQRGLLERLFPRLQAIRCITTAAMGKYVARLRLLAPNTPLLAAAYAATEGAFGVQAELAECAYLMAASTAGAATVAGSSGGGSSDDASSDSGSQEVQPQKLQEAGGGTGSECGSPRSVLARTQPPPSFVDYSREAPEEASFILCPHTGVYFEFLPLGASPSPGELLRLGELCIGGRYELVVTNSQGLFRYRMGDVLRCVGFFGAAPKVVVEGRLSQELNIAGEKTPEPLLLSAVAAAAERVLPGGTLGLKDWAAAESTHTSGCAAGHYVFYWELEPSLFGSGSGGIPAQCLSTEQPLPSAAECAAAVEAALCSPGSSYLRARSTGRLGPAQVCFVAPGTFEGVWELAIAAGASAGQFKPPVVLTKAPQIVLVEGRVLERGCA